MITIRVKIGELSEIKISGHADFAEAGKDIVCAGVSAIYDALCCAVGTDANYCEGKEHVCRTAGSYPCVRMAVMGFQRIAERYRDCVKIVIRI